MTTRVDSGPASNVPPGASTRPTPPEGPDTVSEAHGALNLAPREWREGPRLTPPSEPNEIRQHIVIHKGPNPSYDDLLAFFASYAKLSASYDAKTSPNYGEYISGSGAFEPLLHLASTVIAALVAHNHLPTSDHLEFVGMADDSGDPVVDEICMDSDSYLVSSGSSEEEPPGGEEK